MGSGREEDFLFQKLAEQAAACPTGRRRRYRRGASTLATAMMEAKWHFNAWSLPWLPTTDSSLGGQYASKLVGTAGLPHHLLVERRNTNALCSAWLPPGVCWGRVHPPPEGRPPSNSNQSQFWVKWGRR